MVRSIGFQYSNRSSLLSSSKGPDAPQVPGIHMVHRQTDRQTSRHAYTHTYAGIKMNKKHKKKYLRNPHISTLDNDFCLL